MSLIVLIVRINMPKLHSNSKRIAGLIVVFNMMSLPITTTAATENDLSDLSPQERAFLEDDSFFKTLDVQDSPLKWVEPNKTQGKYWLQNDITIDHDSLSTGFVDFTQCHNNLDAIHAIEIVYNAKTTENLTVLSSKGIGSTVTKAASIALRNVQKDAKICISGKTKTLTFDQKQQHWQLARGPYMRKFLDGYYPMHVQETIQWSGVNINWQKTRVLDESKQQFISLFTNKGRSNSTLANQQLLTVSNQEPFPKMALHSDNTRIQNHYWFEGKLKIHYLFIQNN